jgi:hypothetical protein
MVNKHLIIIKELIYENNRTKKNLQTFEELASYNNKMNKLNN